MVLLAIRNDRFRLAELVEHDDELAALDLLDLARQQVADAAANSSRILRALAFADALDDALLRRLHRRCARTRRSRPGSSMTSPAWNSGSSKRASSSEISRPGPSTSSTTVFRRTMRILPLSLVDLDLGLHGRAVLLRQGGMNAVLQQPVQFRTIELLRVRQLANRGQDLSGTDHPVRIASAPSLAFTVKRQPRLLDCGERNATFGSRALAHAAHDRLACPARPHPTISASNRPPSSRRQHVRPSPDEPPPVGGVRSGRSTQATTPPARTARATSALASSRASSAREHVRNRRRSPSRRRADRCERRAPDVPRSALAGARPDRSRARQALQLQHASSASFMLCRGTPQEQKNVGTSPHFARRPEVRQRGQSRT